jgi:hypothetical protein
MRCSDPGHLAPVAIHASRGLGRRAWVVTLVAVPRTHTYSDTRINRPHCDASCRRARDCHTFVDARFSYHELNPIVGIELDYPIADQVA